MLVPPRGIGVLLGGGSRAEGLEGDNVGLGGSVSIARPVSLWEPDGKTQACSCARRQKIWLLSEVHKVLVLSSLAGLEAAQQHGSILFIIQSAVDSPFSGRVFRNCRK